MIDTAYETVQGCNIKLQDKRDFEIFVQMKFYQKYPKFQKFPC